MKHAADAGSGPGPTHARPGSKQRRTIRYSGHVQGVGFRWTVRSLLVGQPVAGSVRNLQDGTVELVLEGAEAALDAAKAAIRTQFEAQIRHVARTAGTATGEFSGFEILR